MDGCHRRRLIWWANSISPVNVGIGNRLTHDDEHEPTNVEKLFPYRTCTSIVLPPLTLDDQLLLSLAKLLHLFFVFRQFHSYDDHWRRCSLVPRFLRIHESTREAKGGFMEVATPLRGLRNESVVSAIDEW